MQETACEDVGATYVDVARILFGEGGYKAISAIETSRRRWILRSKSLNDEMSDQANILDEQEFNAENTHFREKARMTQVTSRVWHVEEGHRSKQVRVFRCDRGTSEYFPQYASQSGEVLLQNIQQLLDRIGAQEDV